MSAKLSDRCILTSLRIGIWSGRTTDSEVTEEARAKHNAEAGAGTYSKQLIGRKFLSDINKHASAARRSHELLSNPWDDGGTRILTNRMHAKYSEEMRLKKAAFNAAVKALITLYGNGEHLAEAKQRLGSMFNADDYPSTEDLGAKFSFDIEFKPVPDNSQLPKWVGLSETAVKAITKDVERRFDERTQAAMRNVYGRIADVLNTMVDKLRNYEPDTTGKGFRDSLVWNIEQVADVVPYLNITDDQGLAQLAERMKTELTANDPYLLRTNANVRKQTQDKAEQLLNKIKRYL